MTSQSFLEPNVKICPTSHHHLRSKYLHVQRCPQAVQQLCGHTSNPHNRGHESSSLSFVFQRTSLLYFQYRNHYLRGKTSSIASNFRHVRRRASWTRCWRMAAPTRRTLLVTAEREISFGNPRNASSRSVDWRKWMMRQRSCR
jgi:hypothetical protein